MTYFVDISRTHLESDTDALTEIRDGKFVQIRDSSDEYVVFAPRGLCKYHSNIVEHFATSRQLAMRSNRTGETVFLADPIWEIVGGGKMKIDSTEKSIEISGVSQAYGPFDGAGLRKRLAEVFGGYEIIVSS